MGADGGATRPLAELFKQNGYAVIYKSVFFGIYLSDCSR